MQMGPGASPSWFHFILDGTKKYGHESKGPVIYSSRKSEGENEETAKRSAGAIPRSASRRG